MLVLEARDRVGGRVEQVSVDGARPVQLGGEMIGQAHTAYLGLVEELGLTLDSTYTSVAGATTYDLTDGVRRSEEGFPFDTAEQRADYERVERLFGELVATVDPDDPWSHPDAARLDGMSWAGWLRSVDALPSTLRAVEAGALALAAGSSERTSLLSELRKAAAVGDEGFYSYDLWECFQVAEGSAEVALRMGAELGERVRYGAVATAISVSTGGCRVDARLRRGGARRGRRLRAAGQRPPRRRDRRSLGGAPRLHPRAAPGAGGEDRHRLRPLGVGRPRRQRALRGRAAPRLDVAAA